MASTPGTVGTVGLKLPRLPRKGATGGRLNNFISASPCDRRDEIPPIPHHLHLHHRFNAAR